MGLKTDIQGSLAAAFDTSLADAVRPVVFISLSTSSYDPATGVVSPVELRYPTRAVVEPYTAKEIGNSGGSITNSDLKVILLSNEVDAEIKTGMRMEVTGLEQTYSVEVATADPAGASYELQVRS